ncbi:MAG: hypothetical protein ACREFF_15460 [Candidatus Udaeobacter sp.]
MKARVLTDAVVFAAVLIVGLIGLIWSRLPVDKTIWWICFSVFAGWFIIEVCFVSPYRHAQNQEQKNKQLDLEKLRLEDELKTERDRTRPRLIGKIEGVRVDNSVGILDFKNYLLMTVQAEVLNIGGVPSDARGWKLNISCPSFGASKVRAQSKGEKGDSLIDKVENKAIPTGGREKGRLYYLFDGKTESDLIGKPLKLEIVFVDNHDQENVVSYDTEALVQHEFPRYFPKNYTGGLT